MTGLTGKGKGIGIVLCIVLAIVMVGLGINDLAYAASEVRVTVNGKLVQFPDQKPYIDANSRTLVPMRAPMEAMGVKVDWDADKRQAILDNNNTKVVFTIDQKVYQVNGKNKTMDTQAIIMSGRTCIPIRYAAEAFGATVSWDAPNRTAVITTTAGSSVVRPKADLDRQGHLSNEQAKYFRKELEKTVVMDRKNNTISFTLPLLPEGFEWDARLNAIYGPKVSDYKVLVGNDSRIPDGQSYTFEYDYNKITKGYFSFGTCKKGLVSSDWTTFNLKTGKVEYHERRW